MAAYKLLLKKGKKKDLPKLETAEPAFTTDTNELYIGTDKGNIEIAKKEDLDRTTAELDKKIESRASTAQEDIKSRAKGLKDQLNGLAKIVDGKANSAHSHEDLASRGEVAAALNAKADRIHAHVEITSALTNKADKNHGHNEYASIEELNKQLNQVKAQTTRKLNALPSKERVDKQLEEMAPLIHKHRIGDVANLQASLKQNLTELNDTPNSYTGQKGKALVVKDTEDGVEFGTVAGGGVTSIIAGTNITIDPADGTGDVTINSTATGGAAAFTELTDAPSSYSGMANKIVTVNSSANGLEFRDPSAASESDPIFTAALDTDGALAANSDTKVPSQKATKTYADTKVAANVTITGATKTKITYDAKGLVTAGANATTADISDSTNKRYVTDAQLTVLGNTSGTNTGDQDLSGLVPKATTINTKALSSSIVLSTADIADSTDKRYVTDAQRTVIGNTSGTNTGDQNLSGLTTKVNPSVTDNFVSFSNTTGGQKDSGKKAADFLASTTTLDTITEGSTNKYYTSTEKTKLSGIAANANNYVHPNHSGDVTSVADGAQTIASGVVTLAKMANLAQNTMIGRVTASTGVPEALTAANVRTIINVADGANNYVHPNHSGDVTSTGDGATVIGNSKVTLAKMANLAQNTIIGRVTASTGAPEALSAANVRTIINVADGATANTKATGAEINTGTDDVKFATAKALADANISKQVYVNTAAPATPFTGQLWYDTDDSTPISGGDADTIDGQHLTGIIDLLYPVGTIYTSVVSTNPGVLFGRGTWEAFGAGRVMVGIDAGQAEFDTVEETGGAKTITLTTAEMPSHDHETVSDGYGVGLRSDISAGNDIGIFSGIAHKKTTATGGGGAHNNLQPYIVVYMWKRTA